MRRTVPGFVAIVVAMPLLSCSMNLKWDSDADKAPSAPQAALDDSTCQSAGNAYGTPEYELCMQNLAQQRVNMERAENRPNWVPQR
jgi:hypothetical protein